MGYCCECVVGFASLGVTHYGANIYIYIYNYKEYNILYRYKYWCEWVVGFALLGVTHYGANIYIYNYKEYNILYGYKWAIDVNGLLVSYC